MIDLHALFENWFLDKSITKTRLTKFARQHLLAVQADNGSGNYDDIIAATEPLLTTVENCLTDRSTKAGIEKGRVQAKDLFRETLPPKIRVLYSAVAVAYGDPSPDLTMCFPSGRTVFNASGCKDEDLNNHLAQLKNALTARSATVGATHVTTITNLLTQWTALYTDRWEADADTDLSASGQAVAVTALKVQLYKNVHTVALYNLGNVEACNRLCPQSELFPATGPSGPGAATLSAGAWDSGTQTALLTMDATNTTVYTLQDRAVGGGAFATVLDDIAADPDGHATFPYELASGDREVRVIPRDGDGNEGEPSNVVTVHAG